MGKKDQRPGASVGVAMTKEGPKDTHSVSAEEALDNFLPHFVRERVEGELGSSGRRPSPRLRAAALTGALAEGQPPSGRDTAREQKATYRVGTGCSPR